MRSRTALWGLAALLGIAVTATLAWTASQIAGQRIGLASEPLSVSSGLAPSAAPAAQGGGHLTRHAHHRVAGHAPPRVPTVPSTSAAAPPTTSTQSAPAPIALPTTPQPAPAPATAATASRTQQSQSSGGHDDNGGGASSGGGGGSSGGGSHRDD